MTTVLRLATGDTDRDAGADMDAPRPLSAEPGARAVLLEQLRLTGLLLRGGGVLFVLMLVALVVVPTIAMMGAPAGAAGGTNFTFTPESSGAMEFLALIVPLIVWRDEDPTQRDYLWLMPVARGPHTLLRVAAGWAWTMCATLLYVCAIVVLTLVVQRVTGRPQAYHRGFAPWEWLVVFGGTSVAYAYASIAAVTARRPLVWVFGLLAIYAGAVLLCMTQGMPRAAAWLLRAWDGPVGARSALLGVTSAGGDAPSPSAWHWLAATALWGGVALAGLWLAATRRPRRG